MSDNTEFRKELEERTKQINEQIESYLPEEKGHQKTIFEAMNYSVKAGGKRLRPLFMQEIIYRRSTACSCTIYGSH